MSIIPTPVPPPRAPVDGRIRVHDAPTAVFRVPDGAMRRVLVTFAAELVRRIRVVQVRRAVASHEDYRQRSGWQLPEAGSLPEVHEGLRQRAEALAEEFPGVADTLDGALTELACVLDPAIDLGRVWAGATRALTRLAGLLDLDVDDDPRWTLAAGPSALHITLPRPSGPGGTGSGARELSPEGFLAAVREMQRAARKDRQRPFLQQLLIEHVAHGLLAEGHRTAAPVRPWGTSGFRDHQTYMSVTDPGEGHLDGTLRDHRHLEGVIVHVEHLERGRSTSRDAVEPYRIPFPLMIPRVRLALGPDAASSSYVGRPVFEHDVEAGMLKAVHTVAAACSALFGEGLTECKIAVEGMTATQAIRFMRALGAAVRRDRSTQVLSAAINLNTPIVDDRPGRQGSSLGRTSGTSRLDVGLLGIELTRAGRLDKVTWDGTSDSYPSGCVLEQLSPREALTLVHRAHEAGLLTYFSAGFRFEHLASAVETGVDGVGVGGAQILRYMDSGTGHHGPFLPENITRILRVRDEAERSPRGRAAALLSRLDRMRFELSIDVADEARRRDLFEHLAAGGTGDGLDRLLRDLGHVERLGRDTGHPLLGWVRRLERAGARSLLAATADDWWSTLSRLCAAARRHDLEYLSERLEDLRAVSALRDDRLPG